MLSRLKAIFGKSASVVTSPPQTLEDKVSEFRKTLARRELDVNYPFALRNIELTNKCPLKCVMCPRTYSMDRQLGLMDFDLFKKIIDEYVETNFSAASSTTCDMHHFGDSLMHPEYGKFLRYARSRGVYTSDSINPILLKDKMIDQILDGDPLVRLWISLDGHDDATFEKIRGLPRSYERSVAKLERFLDRKVKSGSKTLVYLTVVDFPENKESLKLLRAKWEKHPGIDGFIAKYFVTFDGSTEQINNYSSKYYSEGESDIVWCNDPWTYMTIAWNGDVLPCCNDHNAKYVLGNVKNQTLSEIWQGEPMRALRAELLSGHATNALCSTCEKTKYPRIPI